MSRITGEVSQGFVLQLCCDRHEFDFVIGASTYLGDGRMVVHSGEIAYDFETIGETLGSDRPGKRGTEGGGGKLSLERSEIGDLAVSWTSLACRGR